MAEPPSHTGSDPFIPISFGLTTAFGNQKDSSSVPGLEARRSSDDSSWRRDNRAGGTMGMFGLGQSKPFGNHPLLSQPHGASGVKLGDSPTGSWNDSLISGTGSPKRESPAEPSGGSTTRKVREVKKIRVRQARLQRLSGPPCEFGQDGP